VLGRETLPERLSPSICKFSSPLLHASCTDTLPSGFVDMLIMNRHVVTQTMGPVIRTLDLNSDKCNCRLLDILRFILYNLGGRCRSLRLPLPDHLPICCPSFSALCPPSVKLQLSCRSLYKLVQTCTSQESWQAASSTSWVKILTSSCCELLLRSPIPNTRYLYHSKCIYVLSKHGPRV
jgi:hypothetical protein